MKYIMSDNELLNMFIKEKNILKENQMISDVNKESFISEQSEETSQELKALKEVCKRMVKPNLNNVIEIDKPETLVKWMNLEIGHEMQENFTVIYLDKQNQLIRHKTLFKGTLDSSVVHPREVYKEAVKASASRIILVHNHPSGGLEPSRADVHTTEVLVDAGKLMGIFVLDHLIVSHGNYVSMREKMPHLFIIA